MTSTAQRSNAASRATRWAPFGIVVVAVAVVLLAVGAHSVPWQSSGGGKAAPSRVESVAAAAPTPRVLGSPVASKTNEEAERLAASPAPSDHRPALPPIDTIVTPSLVASVPTLMEAARRGDRRALDELVRADRRCEDVARTLDEAISDAAHVARAFGADRPDLTRALEPYRQCKPWHDAVPPSDSRELMLLAAEADLPSARVRYIQREYQALASGTSMPESLDAYRANAARYLDEMQSSGDAHSLYWKSGAYADGTVYRSDPVSAAAYYGAWLDVSGESSLGRRRMDRLTRVLDDDKAARAQALRAQLVAQFECREGGCR